MTQCCKSRAARRMGSAALTAAAEEEDEASAAGAGAGAGALSGEGACGGERGVEERATAAHARRVEQHARGARAWRPGPAQRRWRWRRRRRRAARRARSARRGRPGRAAPTQRAFRRTAQRASRRGHCGACAKSTVQQRAALGEGAERAVVRVFVLCAVRARGEIIESRVLKTPRAPGPAPQSEFQIPPFFCVCAFRANQVITTPVGEWHSP